METFVDKLRQDYPRISFVQTDRACWSPEKAQISYNLEKNETAMWAVLHELGHALLDHRSYESDVNLLQKEVAAWDKARELGRNYGILINTNHIQDCLDTYRDWLHKRSTCPECTNLGVQPSETAYRCLNCQATWEVSQSRFCRPYRLRKILAA